MPRTGAAESDRESPSHRPPERRAFSRPQGVRSARGRRYTRPHGAQGASGFAARLLRRRRAGRRDGREGARAVRAARVRAQADRPQPARRPRPRGARRDLRRGRGGGARSGETVVFSAHGVAPSVHENSAARSLRTIDATCPLVTKVHTQARRYAAAGLHRDPDRPRRPRGGRRARWARRRTRSCSSSRPSEVDDAVVPRRRRGSPT